MERLGASFTIPGTSLSRITDNVAVVDEKYEPTSKQSGKKSK